MALAFRILIGAALLCAWGASIAGGAPLPEPGDIIFRRGNDAVAETVAGVQSSARGTATKWTHVGIVVRIRPGGRLYVAHALPERGVTLDPIEKFITESTGYTFIHGSERLVPSALFYLGRGYDERFSLVDDRYIYCTELVTATLERAGLQPPKIPLRSVFGVKILMPDDLYSSLLGLKF